MANQFTSELVGVEQAWVDVVAAGAGSGVREVLAEHASKAKLRTISAWLDLGAPYDYASPATIHDWRKVLAAAGDPRTKPPIMYLPAARSAA